MGSVADHVVSVATSMQPSSAILFASEFPPMKRHLVLLLRRQLSLVINSFFFMGLKVPTPSHPRVSENCGYDFAAARDTTQVSSGERWELPERNSERHPMVSDY